MSYTYIHVHISAYVKKYQDLVGTESQEKRWIINKNIGLKLRPGFQDTTYHCDFEEGIYPLCVHAVQVA